MAFEQHQPDVVGFPYSYYPPQQLSLDTKAVLNTDTSSDSPIKQCWIDVRPLTSPTTPISQSTPSWTDVRPLSMVSSSASIFSFQSRSSLTRAKLSELRRRFRGSISTSTTSRPPSLISDLGSVSATSTSPPLSPLASPSPTVHGPSYFPLVTSSTQDFGRPSTMTSSQVAKHKRNVSNPEPAPGWARVIAEKDDLAFMGRQLQWVDVIDTEDRMGAMIDSLNGTSPHRGRRRTRRH